MSERAQTLLATVLLGLNLLGWWWDRRRWRRLIEEAEDRVIDALVASPFPLRETIESNKESRRSRRVAEGRAAREAAK